MTELVVIRCPECGTKAGSISEQDDGELAVETYFPTQEAGVGRDAVRRRRRGPAGRLYEPTLDGDLTLWCKQCQWSGTVRGRDLDPLVKGAQRNGQRKNYRPRP